MLFGNTGQGFALILYTQEYFKIIATHLGKKAVSHTDIDFTQPVAVVFGNESGGISDQALALADFVVKIPMVGMSQSLNLSVSAGIILYEALRQRAQKDEYKQNKMPEKDFKALRDLWLGRKKDKKKR